MAASHPQEPALYCVTIDGLRKDLSFPTMELARAFADQHRDASAEIWAQVSVDDSKGIETYQRLARRAPKSTVWLNNGE